MSLVSRIVKHLKGMGKLEMVVIAGFTPLVASGVWVLLDPVIGNVVPSITYGEVTNIPRAYTGTWSKGPELLGDEPKKLMIKGKILTYTSGSGSDLSFSICRPRKISIDYALDNKIMKYGPILSYPFGLLPRTLFGNQRVFIDCESRNSSKSRWVLNEPYNDDYLYNYYKNCMQLQISHEKSSYPLETYLCR